MNNEKIPFSGQVWQSEFPKFSSVSDIRAHLLSSTPEAGSTPEQIKEFLSPTLSDIPSPWMIDGIDLAVDRIIRAINDGERIMVFGDFDTDGITSSVLLVTGLTELGAKASVRIPDREKDSHGMKFHHVDEIKKTGSTLIITCDCGINDADKVAYAAEQGIDVIVTDHHTPEPDRFPVDAVAVLNPHLEHCPYPYADLAGVGVAFKLLCALAEKFMGEDAGDLSLFLQKYLELTAVGLIADCMPLNGENRTLAKCGLQCLSRTQWPAFQQMFEAGNIVPESVDEQTIGFHIAPRLNAASRIGDVYTAVNAFLQQDPNTIASNLSGLDTYNAQRKTLTHTYTETARRDVSPDSTCITYFAPGWRAGILGLVAGKLSQAYRRPAVVITDKSEEIICASCRAPQGFGMDKALQSISHLLDQFGGHDAAAGFSAPVQNLQGIQDGLDTYYAAFAPVQTPIAVAGQLSPAIITDELIEFLRTFGPYGQQHSEPHFVLSDFRLTGIKPLGDPAQHLRVSGTVSGRQIDAMAFFAGHWLPMLELDNTYELLVTLSWNFFRGDRKVQLRVSDIRRI